MSKSRFDWRWVAVIALLALLANSYALPGPLVALALVAAGGYVIYETLRKAGFSAGIGGGPRVTYWRGQKIELDPPARRKVRMPSGRNLTRQIVPLLIGAALIITGIAIGLRSFTA